MGAEQVELDDHRVVAVAQRDHLVPLVGERDSGVVVVAAHRRVAVVDGLRQNDLVARVREGRQDRVPLLSDLVAEVVEHDLLAMRTNFFGDHGCSLRRHDVASGFAAIRSRLMRMRNPQPARAPHRPCPGSRHGRGRRADDPPPRLSREGSEPVFAWPVGERSDVSRTSLHQPTSPSETSHRRSALSGSTA